MSNYVITIARGFGSGGKAIGKALSEKLGIPCYDSQILNMASDYSGISKAIFNQADEKLSGHRLIKKLLAVPNTDHIVGPMDKSFTSDMNLYNIQAQIIRELAKTQSCIIIGKCANHVLRKYKNVLSVYVEAPRKDCIDSVVNLMGVSEDEANKMIYRTDKYRSDYYKYYTGGENWRDPMLYDITLNSAKLGREACVQFIAQGITIKLGKNSGQ